MRRLFVGMAMMATMSMPLSAWSGDREIAEQIILKLKTHRDSGALKDFKVDLKVNDGVVAFNGSVASLAQRNLVLEATKSVDGIKDIVDDMKLPVATANDSKAAQTAEPTLVMGKPAVQSVPKTNAISSIKKPQPVMIVDATPAGVVKPAADIKPAGIVKPAQKVIVPEAIAQPTAGPVTQLASSIEPIEVMPVGNKRPVAAQPTAGDRDRELNARITQALTQAKQDGRLRGFAMDITTNDGEVWLQGRTVTGEQRASMLEIVRNVPGVTNVVDDIKVLMQDPSAKVRQASDSVPVFQASPMPLPQGLAPASVRPVPRPVAHAAPQAGMTRSPARMMPVPYRPSTMPQPYANASSGMMVQGATMMGGQPMPMQPASAGMAYGSPRTDQPNLPNYAWPGYSAYPNYAALSYPKQYSPSAWPYIGPFYPYPQVPLNWRKVTLEWDDGWWQLDYSSKSR
ncbi:periplasmic protein [Rosistilla carotiformis]|uniref:Periplasmic protein n=1 Tax=Rosistilla carotiformis TaxID=2528017 RepID=A0A518JPY7_9BACT|nr:BON domain-containing protein [Rosistilla carotiformis]QDV67602.1 periplasmic protein [Rosistilla carotiformis]